MVKTKTTSNDTRARAFIIVSLYYKHIILLQSLSNWRQFHFQKKNLKKRW